MSASDYSEPCGEYIDLGPFRFECSGHVPGARDRAFQHHGGKLTHHAVSPQDVGDADVTFWTWLEPEDEWERSRLDRRHPSHSDRTEAGS